MQITALKSKIHRATVTAAELDYVGSITIDAELMDSAGIFEYEKVQVVDVDNGNRLETYAISGERGSGVICLNGAAARCVQPKDRVIIMAYAVMTPEELKENPPKVVFVDNNNKITKITDFEKHGKIENMFE
jgi:aspartate 1-decarboxylase